MNTLTETQRGTGFTCNCDIVPPHLCPQHMTDTLLPSPDSTHEYVAGFCFRGPDHCRKVALVRKTKPAWQAGFLNGIGGSIEPGETPAEAMHREFTEETGAILFDWRQFAILEGNGFRVHFFETTLPQQIPPAWVCTQTPTDPILWTTVDSLNRFPNTQTIPNLRWLIPMALDKDQVTARVTDDSLPGEGA